MGDGAREPNEHVRARETRAPRSQPARASAARPARATARSHATLDPQYEQDCFAALASAGVAFERVDAEAARGVAEPTRLLGPIGGIDVVTRDKQQVHAILDCRLALALLSWSSTLRRSGITGIEHYSMYRPGARVRGKGKVSGHAHGLAIDAARFHTADGSVLDVVTDWEDRDRNGDPCLARPDEAWPSRTLRAVVCDAVKRNLFQIVITPHHDSAHGNHIHLERKPDVSYTYLR